MRGDYGRRLVDGREVLGLHIEADVPLSSLRPPKMDEPAAKVKDTFADEVRLLKQAIATLRHEKGGDKNE